MAGRRRKNTVGSPQASLSTPSQAPTMAPPRLAPPDALDFDTPEQWDQWITRFNRYREVTKLSSSTEDEQINTLIYVMGPKAEEIYQTFQFSNTAELTYVQVVKQFNQYFSPKRNIVYERCKFNQRSQLENETVSEFITSVYSLAENCDYRNLKHELIRDRIVAGHNRNFKPRGNYSNNSSKHVGTVPSVGQTQSKNTASNAEKSNTLCQWCGYQAHSRNVCPARNASCNSCNRRGHFARVCNASGHSVDEVSEAKPSGPGNTVDPVHTIFIGAIVAPTGSTKMETAWYRKVNVRGTQINFKLDTGSAVTCISSACAPLVPLQKSGKVLLGPGAHRLSLRDTFLTTLEYKNRCTEDTVYVIDNLQTPLLGLHALEILDLVRLVDSVDKWDSRELIDLECVKEQFPRLFSGLEEIGSEYKLKLKNNAQPYAITSPRRIPIPLWETVKIELGRMVLSGIISPVTEPSEWCAPMVVVPKKNGSIRICVDLRQLNQAVRREVYPIPDVTYILSQIKGATKFSRLDANSGFYQIKLEPRSRQYTTFLTPFGRYCFNRLPFGITSVPEVSQREISQTLQDCRGTVCLMDDILIYGSTEEEHNRRLARVLDKLQNIGLTLNESKSVVNVDKVEFLGHLLDKEGIHVHPSKVQAIVDMPHPCNKKELQHFLGMVNFLAKAIPDRATVLEPMFSILRKDCDFYWGPAQAEAFARVKTILTSAPVLAVYDSSKRTVVTADASQYGIRGALLQYHGDMLRPVAYVSRTLSAAEQRNAQIEKEALASTWVCKRLSDYLIGKSFILETDHKPLVPIFMTKSLNDLSPRLQRFRLRLMRFDFMTVHVPGKDLIIADNLSRKPLPQTDDTLDTECNEFVCAVIPECTDSKFSELIKQQKDDGVLGLVRAFVIDGWPAPRK